MFRILLVEDHPEIREAFVDLLTSKGYDVHAVGSAELGLEHLRKRRYDLLITDHSLPRESGAWMIDQAERAGLLPMPVMMVSAHPVDASSRADQFLQKPVDVLHFLQAVEAHLLGERPPLRLKLFVSRRSPASVRAEKNLRSLLSGYQPASVEVSLHEVFDGQETTRAAVELYKVVSVPLLVVPIFGTPTRVIGDLSQGHDHLRELFLAGGARVR